MTNATTTQPAPASILYAITYGARVTLRTPQGHERTGTATLRGPHGWVLNMGGLHGTPGVATDANIVKVRHPRATAGV